MRRLKKIVDRGSTRLPDIQGEWIGIILVLLLRDGLAILSS